MATAKLGLDAKLYRNTGSYGSPSWAEIENVRDLTLSMPKGEADVSTRGNGGWGADAGTLKRASIEFSMVNRESDTDLDAIRDSFLNNTDVEYAVMDGNITTSGSEGLRATMQVFNFSRNEALEEAITYDVSIKPTIADNAPEWLTI